MPAALPSSDAFWFVTGESVSLPYPCDDVITDRLRASSSIDGQSGRTRSAIHRAASPSCIPR